MKQTLIILALVMLAFASCTTKEEIPVFHLAPGTMFRLNPDISAFHVNKKLRSSDAHLSAIEIVRQGSVISFRNPAKFGDVEISRMFGDGQRDTISIPPCLLMFATDIISDEGEYVSEFIEGHDFLIKHWNNRYQITDTIAYIPNSVIEAARDSIKSAMARNDTESAYRIFNNAFTFRPITGAEWIELKRQGLQ